MAAAFLPTQHIIHVVWYITRLIMFTGKCSMYVHCVFQSMNEHHRDTVAVSKGAGGNGKRYDRRTTRSVRANDASLNRSRQLAKSLVGAVRGLSLAQKNKVLEIHNSLRRTEGASNMQILVRRRHSF